MEKDTLPSHTEFIDSVNNVVKPPFKSGYFSICRILIGEVQKQRNNHNTALANALYLCHDLCLMHMQPDSPNEPFRAFTKSNDSAIPDDFTELQLSFLEQVYEGIDNTLIKARIADLLWLLKRQYHMALHAIDCYTAQSITDEKIWIAYAKDCWVRATQLSLQVNDRQRVGDIEEKLLNAFNQETVSGSYLKLWLSELIGEYDLCKDHHDTLGLDNLTRAKVLLLESKYVAARDYAIEAQKMLSNERQAEIVDAQLLVAQSFEQEAELFTDHVPQGQLQANSLYTQAIHAYRRIPKKHREGYDVDSRLSILQKKLIETGEATLAEMAPLYTGIAANDESKKLAKEHVSNKENLATALCFFVGLKHFDYKMYRESILKSQNASPFSQMFDEIHFSGDGRVVSKLKGAGFNQVDENNLDKLTAHSFCQDICKAVNGAIIPALKQILLEFRVTKPFLRALCYHSPIVPKNRENLMANALWCGFEMEFSDATHLITPQVEHMIRILYKSYGINTFTTKGDDTQDEVGLSSLLTRPEDEEPKPVAILGETNWFVLKAIFTDSIGANLRNNVAHGLLDDYAANQPACVYAWWFVLKLVVESLYFPEGLQLAEEKVES